ncbi:MAG: hypothetical protein ACRCZ0_00615 [Cetobacterium sp.]
MDLCKIEGRMQEIRKECKANDKPFTSSVEYMALVQKKNKITKIDRAKEIKLAKVRDLWNDYCLRTKDKPSKQEFLKTIRGVI